MSEHSSALLEPTLRLPENSAYMGFIKPTEVIDYEAKFIDRDELNLSFLNEQIDVYKTVLSDGAERFDLTSRREPMDGNEFITLLSETAPATTLRVMSAYGIIADWRILDEGDNSEFATKLVELHEHLGSSWMDFAASQPFLIKVLRDIPGLQHNPFQFKLKHLTNMEAINDGHLLEAFLENAVNSPDSIGQACELVGIDNIEDFVLSSIAKAISRGRPNHRVAYTPQTKDELWRRYSSWGMDRRKKLVKGIMRQSLKFGIVNTSNRSAIFDRFYDHIEIDGNNYAHPRAEIAEDSSLEQAYLARYRIREGDVSVSVMDLPSKNGQQSQTFIVPNSFEYYFKGYTVKPHLSWIRREDGQRELIIERYQSGHDNLVHHDGIVGILLLAYFSPEIRSSWREKGHIMGRAQDMREAQVPVLALMKKRELLDSLLVRAVEEL